MGIIRNKTWLAATFGLTIFGSALAQPTSPPAGKRELIYCADRMSHEEREAYRARMRSARSMEEREALRAAHRSEMQARASHQDNGACEPQRQQRQGGPGK